MTASGRCPVTEYLSRLDARDRAAVTYAIDILEELGIELGSPHARHVRGKVWELRARGRVQHRVLYFASPGRRLILLHAFVKKTRQTPSQEIELALARLSDYEARAGS